MTTAEPPPATVIMAPAEFDAKFASLFRHEAFRLELLDCYDSPRTRERLQRFLAREPQDPAARAGWDALLAAAQRTGKIMSRVHVVSEPLTDYLRFELDFYRQSVAGGEDVRILPRAEATGVDLPGFDFWLFDGQAAAIMAYDQAGLWLHAEMITTPGFTAKCRQWRDTARNHALPLHEYEARRVIT